MKRLIGIIFLAVGLLAASHAAEPEMRLSPRKVRDEVRAVVEAQLAALRTGDFATAYEFAASGIKRQFDERVFEAMIRRGYAPLLKPELTELGVVRDDGAATAQVSVTATDKQKRSTVYRYWLAKEDDVWRISGVLLEQRPARGDI